MDAQAERIIAGVPRLRRARGARGRDEAERQLLWKGRKSAFGAYGRISPAYMVMDGVIPRTKLPYVLGRVNEIVGRPRPARRQRVPRRRRQSPPEHPLRSAQARARRRGWWRRAREIMKVCAEVGGSISGEHGIGLEKADYMPFIFSEADLACMRLREGRVQSDRPVQSGQDLSRASKSCGEAGAVAYRPHPIEEKGLAQRF